MESSELAEDGVEPSLEDNSRSPMGVSNRARRFAPDDTAKIIEKSMNRKVTLMVFMVRNGILTSPVCFSLFAFEL